MVLGVSWSVVFRGLVWGRLGCFDCSGFFVRVLGSWLVVLFFGFVFW